MFSLSFLFLILPLYFSHIFMHFGVVVGDGISFERQKMYLFILMVLIALAEMIFTRYDTLIAQIRKHGLIILGLILLPLVPTLLYRGEIDTYWIHGSYEKFHGYLLYVSIILLGFCISLLDMHEKKKIVQLSFIPLLIVSIIAILEGLSIQVFSPPSSGIWGEGVRAISTLGNPNYLAGYLLIMLPLVGYIRTPERYFLVFLILVALFMTGSYIGIGIGIMYGIYMFFEWIYSSFRARQSVSVAADEKSSISRTFSDTLFGRSLTHDRDKRVRNDKTGNSWLPLLSTLIITGGAVVLGYLFLPPDKLLSFTSRGVLMREVASQLLSYPLAFFTGFGPESIIRFFMGVRSAIIDSYFPRNSIIDSSHNIILDIVFQYGTLPIILLASAIYKNYHTWNPHARESWILGIAFLMFNPYVVVHLTLLALALSLHDDRS